MITQLSPSVPTSVYRRVRPMQVHKRHPRALLVERWTQVGADVFRLHCRAPQAESPMAGPDGAVDLTGFVEMFRQSCILVAHQALGVPDDEAFALSRLEVEQVSDVDPTALAEGFSLRLVIDHRTHRGSRLAAIQTSGTFTHRGRVVATFDGATGLIPHRVFEAMRGGAQPRELRPGGARLPEVEVGVTSPDDVLVRRDSDDTLRLALDTCHVWHFDHPTDHVPGMTLVEGALQARQALTGRPRPRWLAATFDRYTELGPEPELHVQDTRDGIEIRQEGAVVALLEFGDARAAATVG